MATAMYYQDHRGKVVCCGCFEDKPEFDEELEKFQDCEGVFTYVEEEIKDGQEPICESCQCFVEVD